MKITITRVCVCLDIYVMQIIKQNHKFYEIRYTYSISSQISDCLCELKENFEAHKVSGIIIIQYQFWMFYHIRRRSNIPKFIFLNKFHQIWINCMNFKLNFLKPIPFYSISIPYARQAPHATRRWLHFPRSTCGAVEDHLPQPAHSPTLCDAWGV